MKKVDWEGKPTLLRDKIPAEIGFAEGRNATLTQTLNKTLRCIDLQSRNQNGIWKTDMRNIVIRYRQCLLHYARKMEGEQEQIEEGYGGVWMPEYAYDVYRMKKNKEAIAKLREHTPHVETVISDQKRYFNKLIRKASVSGTKPLIVAENGSLLPTVAETKEPTPTDGPDTTVVDKPMSKRRTRATTAPNPIATKPRRYRPNYRFPEMIKMIDETINLRGDLAAGTNTSAMMSNKEKSRRAKKRWKKIVLAYLSGHLGNIPAPMHISADSKRNFLSGALSWTMLMCGMNAVAVYTRPKTMSPVSTSSASQSPEFKLSTDMSRFYLSAQRAQRFNKDGYLRKFKKTKRRRPPLDMGVTFY